MRHPKLVVRFDDLCEIAMGSTYKLATLKVEGAWVPDLPATDWQNLHAESESGRFHALVRWDNANGDAAFRIVVLDTMQKKVVQSDRIEGCCSGLEWRGTGLSVQIFRHLSDTELGTSSDDGLVPRPTE